MRLVENDKGRRGFANVRNEPKPVGDLVQPPDWFSDDEKKVWASVLQSAPAGLLKRLDGGMLEGWVLAYCIRRDAATKLRAEQVKNVKRNLLVKTPNGTAMQSPFIGIINRQTVIMKAIAAEMGFSPAARTRVSLEEGAGVEDPTDRYFGAA